MIWNKRDPWRWRRRFAWLPRRVGGHWVWLIQYAWRPLKSEEVPPHKKLPHPLDLYIKEWWEEWVVHNGPIVWKCYTYHFGGLSHVHTSWHQPRPELRVIS